MRHACIILRGEAFRQGSQFTRTRGSSAVYDAQIEACNSHLAFFKHLQKQDPTLKLDVVLDTYTTDFDLQLSAIYSSYLVHTTFRKDLAKRAAYLIKESIETAIKQEKQYEYIMVLRLDLFLKQKFIETFHAPQDKILFLSVCWHQDRKTHNNQPRVNDVFYYFPIRQYHKMFAFMTKPTFYHDSLGLVKLERSDYDFITREYVDSDSEKDYNHYYRIIGRSESAVFHSYGKSWPADFD